ncbi:hypothetical protein FNO08_10290 [Salmonella enterica subsp. diarizonae]|nr:hypothetical protein [Salmonella enterica subsp. diarizonae]ECF5965987.1 hypothetical protein [Salmonella enterica subsp. diarizonae]
MKTILKDVQLAIVGTCEDGCAITADMLRNIASNFKGNQYPHIVKDSLSQKAKTHEMVGYVTSVYFKECNGESALFGDLEFTQCYDMSTLKETFDNRVYPAIEITILHPGYESLFKLHFTDKQYIKGLRKINFRKCVCIGREENAQIMLEQSAVRFNKKYDNANSGLIGYVSGNDTNKIYLNETDTLEAKDGYLIINKKETIEAVRIEMIGVITSTDNRKGSSNISIHTTSCSIEIRNSDIGAKGILKFIERYKESQFAELKVSCS